MVGPLARPHGARTAPFIVPGWQPKRTRWRFFAIGSGYAGNRGTGSWDSASVIRSSQPHRPWTKWLCDIQVLLLLHFVLEIYDLSFSFGGNSNAPNGTNAPLESCKPLQEFSPPWSLFFGNPLQSQKRVSVIFMAQSLRLVLWHSTLPSASSVLALAASFLISLPGYEQLQLGLSTRDSKDVSEIHLKLVGVLDLI